jgi:hypothetical protein
MVTMRKIVAILFFFASALGFGQVTACLHHEPSVVKLQGTLTRKTFPGPPEYESVRTGDKPEIYWLLVLSAPICVDADKAEPSLFPAQENIRSMQLVVGPGDYKRYRSLVGKRVVAEGTLFGQHTAHHYTAVLLTVNKLAKAKN